MKCTHAPGSRNWLRRGDFRAECAADGVEGLDRVRQWSPGIVVTDLKMPRMEGMELSPASRNCSLTSSSSCSRRKAPLSPASRRCASALTTTFPNPSTRPVFAPSCRMRNRHARRPTPTSKSSQAAQVSRRGRARAAGWFDPADEGDLPANRAGCAFQRLGPGHGRERHGQRACCRRLCTILARDVPSRLSRSIVRRFRRR